jgi:hypothetical protein
MQAVNAFCWSWPWLGEIAGSPASPGAGCAYCANAGTDIANSKDALKNLAVI